MRKFKCNYYIENKHFKILFGKLNKSYKNIHRFYSFVFFSYGFELSDFL